MITFQHTPVWVGVVITIEALLQRQWMNTAIQWCVRVREYNGHCWQGTDTPPSPHGSVRWWKREMCLFELCDENEVVRTSQHTIVTMHTRDMKYNTTHAWDTTQHTWGSHSYSMQQFVRGSDSTMTSPVTSDLMDVTNDFTTLNARRRGRCLPLSLTWPTNCAIYQMWCYEMWWYQCDVMKWCSSDY